MDQELEQVVVNPLVVMQTMESGAVLMHVPTGDCFELNRTGQEVWKRLTNGEAPGTIAAALAASYDLPADRLASDVHQLVAQLLRHGLVTPAPPGR